MLTIIAPFVSIRNDAAVGEFAKLVNTVIILVHMQDRNLGCFDNPLSSYED